MATELQHNAVEKIVESRRNPKSKKTKGQILLDAGYSKNTAIKPNQVLGSRGFREVLAEYGLTEELITTALVSDIEAKPRKRFLELSLGADILGMKKRDAGDEPKKSVIAIQVIVNGGNNPTNRTDQEAVGSA